MGFLSLRGYPLREQINACKGGGTTPSCRCQCDTCSAGRISSKLRLCHVRAGCVYYLMIVSGPDCFGQVEVDTNMPLRKEI